MKIQIQNVENINQDQLNQISKLYPKIFNYFNREISIRIDIIKKRCSNNERD